jgi:acetyl esterase/lipase
MSNASSITTRCAFLVTVAMLGLTPAAPAQMPRNAPSHAPAQPATTSPENSPVSVKRDVVYGTAGGHPLLLDVYAPDDGSFDPRPAIVLIHGGAWTSFDKSTMSGMGNFLARSGFVAFSVDYRLFNGSGNLWPAQLDDVQRAVRWIRANAANYHVDPSQIGAFGHSAGAQLAALLGMEDTRDNSDPALARYSSKVQAVVDVSGPTDFTTNHDPDRDAFMATFLGGDYAHHPEIWQDASPVFHVAKKVAPFLILHGTKDEAVPIAQAQELTDKLKAAHASVRFVKVEDGHDLQTSGASRRMALETRDFFVQYLR